MPNKIIQKECAKHGLTDFILEGRGYYRCKACRCARVNKWRKDSKVKLKESFGGKCEICGYARCLQALDFHHVFPEDKEFGISDSGSTWAYEKMVQEAKKCVLLCGNCHTEVECGLQAVPAELVERVQRPL
jgi:hypothetical protein